MKVKETLKGLKEKHPNAVDTLALGATIGVAFLTGHVMGKRYEDLKISAAMQMAFIKDPAVKESFMKALEDVAND